MAAAEDLAVNCCRLLHTEQERERDMALIMTQTPPVLPNMLCLRGFLLPESRLEILRPLNDFSVLLKTLPTVSSLAVKAYHPL